MTTLRTGASHTGFLPGLPSVYPIFPVYSSWRRSNSARTDIPTLTGWRTGRRKEASFTILISMLSPEHRPSARSRLLHVVARVPRVGWWDGVPRVCRERHIPGSVYPPGYPGSTYQEVYTHHAALCTRVVCPPCCPMYTGSMPTRVHLSYPRVYIQGVLLPPTGVYTGCPPPTHGLTVVHTSHTHGLTVVHTSHTHGCNRVYPPYPRV